MNKIVRAVVMAGVSVAAGVTMAAGPASVASASPSTPSAGEKRVATQQKAYPRRDRIAGVYRSLRTCDRVGQAGQWKRQWGRYACVRINRGYQGGWALKVSSGWNRHYGGGGHHGGGYPGGGYYKATR